jgi:hypothetical protein
MGIGAMKWGAGIDVDVDVRVVAAYADVKKRVRVESGGHTKTPNSRALRNRVDWKGVEEVVVVVRNQSLLVPLLLVVLDDENVF